MANLQGRLTARLTSILGNALSALTAIAIAIAVLWGFGLAADNAVRRVDPSYQTSR